MSEMVLERLDFDAEADWFCVEGGSQQIALKMRDHIKDSHKIEFSKRVKAMSYVSVENGKVVGPSQLKDGDCSEKGKNVMVSVTLEGEDEVSEETRGPFHAVFNSAPLGAMQHMYLEGLNLNWVVKRAIRNLGYGASCKVGVRFKTLWWMQDKYGPIRGGQANTDLPIRCCVYPSYNVEDPVDQPGVLLASYTWSQEAERIGAHIKHGGSPESERRLRDLLLHDLARLHTSNEVDYAELRALLDDEYLDHFAYNWNADPHTVGAFAYFGPGQFRGMYPGLSKTDGKHVIIGEAASAHHAWVVGALESAVRGVYQFLFKHSHRSRAACKATEAYNYDNVPAPFGPLPAEYDRTQEVTIPCSEHGHSHGPGVVAQTSAIGEIARLQVWQETNRLKQGGDRLDPDRISEEAARPILRAIEQAIEASPLTPLPHHNGGVVAAGA